MRSIPTSFSCETFPSSEIPFNADLCQALAKLVLGNASCLRSAIHFGPRRAERRAVRVLHRVSKRETTYFMDNVEQEHESVRVMPFTGEQAEMRPVAEIRSGKQTHLCVRGLEPSHIHAILRQPE